jgi:hypothetical protein
MTTYPPTPFLFEVLNKEGVIPLGDLAYFRGRLSNRIHELVLSEFAEQERKNKTSRADLARRIGRKPEQITRWLGSPGNWTLDTISDLLLGMGLELGLSIKSLSGQQTITVEIPPIYANFNVTFFPATTSLRYDSLNNCYVAPDLIPEQLWLDRENISPAFVLGYSTP